MKFFKQIARSANALMIFDHFNETGEPSGVSQGIHSRPFFPSFPFALTQFYAGSGAAQVQFIN